LPFTLFDKNAHVAHGAIMENKRLGAMLAVIQQGGYLPPYLSTTSRSALAQCTRSDLAFLCFSLAKIVR
jgi:hypothetical protein